VSWTIAGMWSIMQFWDSEVCACQLFRGCTPLFLATSSQVVAVLKGASHGKCPKASDLYCFTKYFFWTKICAVLCR